ncbi:MAG: type I-F CRISPR-associated protein Csy2 [Gammaproteobacteria bacterium]|nr:type I-F CRISPR-associated protein Csy2 [Gammaproteobacteria bacterium]
MSDVYILIPHLRIQNANALSSPFTIGFPAMTAWLGAIHALQRKLNAQDIPVEFEGVGVVSHKFDLQTYKGYGDFGYSIIGMANPVDKDGSRPAFIEEARCHLEASLVIRYENCESLYEDELLAKIEHQLRSGMKMAGGDIIDLDKPSLHRDFNRLKTKLMPGYAIIERRELMIEAMERGQDALDAMLDYLVIHHQCEMTGEGEQSTVTWKSARKETGHEGQRGWIVPIATGFHGISELGQAKNQRNPDTPHRFVESIVTLGEFKMPYKLDTAEELFWRYHFDLENNLYLCQQTGAGTTLTTPDSTLHKTGF